MTRAMRHRSRSTRNALLTAAVVVLLICKAGEAQDHVLYTDSFPTNDEYDVSILDPHHIYGSPYGGFGRATRSRLAALPLPLPGIVGEFDASSEDAIYLETRDGDGRLFACRVYHQDEVEAISLTDSMFNAPITRDPHAKEEGKTTVKAADPDDESASDEPQTLVAVDEKTPVNIHSDADNTNNEDASSTIPNDVLPALTVDTLLTKLKGVCTQIHMGWWSYEWCHEDKVAQFHIRIDEHEKQKLHLDDVTNLGTHTSRSIQQETDNDDDIDKATTAQSGTTTNENVNVGSVKHVAVVIDKFEGGDICEETQKPRRTTVKLQCCSLEKMNRFKNAVLYHGKPVKSNIAAIRLMQETSTCNYFLQVCTPLLCEGLAEAFEDGLVAKEIAPKAKASIPKQLHQVPTTRTPRQRKEGESIREILEANLKNTCLQYNDGGWWVYDVCHERHVRQYHEADVFDAATGFYSRVPEDVYYLGYYKAQDLEGFPDEDEPLHVTKPSDDNDIVSKKKKASRREGSGAYFSQEYTGGNVCDHSDVTDSAIKAGAFREGKMERAATLRYFCAKDFTVTQVSEDSTCHYIIDITVPDLCNHPLFKAPVVKKQVVKCLPVDESFEFS